MCGGGLDCPKKKPESCWLDSSCAEEDWTDTRELRGGMACSAGAGTRTLYAEPKTFMEALLECSNFIDKLRRDSAYTKEDVLDSMETRLSFLVGKMATNPTCMPFKIFPDPADSS